MDACTYKRLKNEFAKNIIPPPIKLYNILEIKINKNKLMFTFYLYLAFTNKKCEINKLSNELNSQTHLINNNIF